jgi:hypothetical protein
VLKVPESLGLEGVAPLFCAGITSYSPLRHRKVGKGQKAGAIGLGGLGHMGIKFAKALGRRSGAEVTMITTSVDKGKDARRLGADEVLLSSDGSQIASPFLGVYVARSSQYGSWSSADAEHSRQESTIQPMPARSPALNFFTWPPTSTTRPKRRALADFLRKRAQTGQVTAAPSYGLTCTTPAMPMPSPNECTSQ